MPEPQPASPPNEPRAPLQIQQELARAWAVLRFQPQRMLQVASSVPDALEVAAVFLVAGGILSYIGGLIYPFELGGRVWPLAQASRVLAVIVQLLLTVGLVWLMAALARRFRAPLRFEQLFKILGYAGIVFVLTLFPSLMLVAFAWWFAAAYVALRGPGQLDAERALLVVLCAVIALFVVARLAASFGVYLWHGRWSPIRFR